MQQCNTIMALVLDDRLCCAPAVQEKLTAHGCVIRVRLGVHEGCDEKGLILLNVCGAEEQVKALAGDLRKVPGVKVSSMQIEF